MGKKSKRKKEEEDDDEYIPMPDDFPGKFPPAPEGGWFNPQRVKVNNPYDPPEGGTYPPIPDDPVDIRRFDLRVGKIIFAMPHPINPETHMLTYVNIGDKYPRPIVSQIGRNYKKEDLEKRLVVTLCNTEPMELPNICNRSLLMCACQTDSEGQEQYELWNPPPEGKVGDTFACENYAWVPTLTHAPHTPFMRWEDKIYDQVVADLRINSEKEVVYKDTNRLFIKKKEGFIRTSTFADCPIKTNPV